MGGVVRKRKARASKMKKQEDSEQQGRSNGTNDKDAGKLQQSTNHEETLWDTFLSHPLVKVAPIVLIPYFVYRAFYLLLLQHPEYLNEFGVRLRPAIGPSDERQVLIVGTMSSGTVQVANDLQTIFQLEVGHEASDAFWYFVRDGTVSWFHGIRFWEQPAHMPSAVAHVCANFTANMGFHPTMFRSTSGCSTRQKWSRCWAAECFQLLQQEWGCGLPHYNNTCLTPFRRTLHQVRHPLRTIESLVAKLCVDGVDGTVHPSFQQFLVHLIPTIDKSDSCIEVAAKFVLYYNRAMLDARRRHNLIQYMYQIETTTPCEIAEMAGLLDEYSAVYAQQTERIRTICNDPDSAGRAPIQSTKNIVNKGHVQLEWNDLKGGLHGSSRPVGDDELMEAVQRLTVELGYDADQQ